MIKQNEGLAAGECYLRYIEKIKIEEAEYYLCEPIIYSFPDFLQIDQSQLHHSLRLTKLQLSHLLLDFYE